MRHHRIRGLFVQVAFTALLVATGPVVVVALDAGKAPAAKYIAVGEIDLKALLADPPADGSDIARAEIEQLLKLQAARTPEQVARAQAEDTLTLFAFASVLGTNFTPATVPITNKLFTRVGTDIMAVSHRAKMHWKRARPFNTDARIQTVGRKASSLSYPSGHATRAFAWAMVLGELVPTKKTELLERAKEIGDDRLIAGMHYPSDVEAGTKLGKAIGAKLLASATFRQELDAARRELATVLVSK
jgi:acid phosphatase (class A)